jgi:hypothetical protein
MKRIITIGAALAIFGLLVGLFFSRQGVPAPEIPEAPVVPVESPPRTIEFPTLPAGAEYVYDGPDVELPLSAALYHISPAASGHEDVQNRAIALASQFGFTASPSAFWRSGVFAALWDTPASSFTVSFSKDILSLSLSQRQTTARALLAGSPGEAAGLVSRYLPPPTGVLFGVTDTRTSGFDGVVVLDGPGNLIGYTLGLAVIGTPVLTGEYAAGWGEVVVDGSGVVRMLSAIVPFRSLTPAGEVPLISLDDAVANLNAGNGALLWITDETAPVGYGTTPTIMRAVVREVALVYVVVGDTLRPAYLLGGSGIQSTVEQTFRAIVFASSL